MDKFFPKILDQFLRRHPIAASLALVVLGLVAFWILTGSGHEFLIYEGF